MHAPHQTHTQRYFAMTSSIVQFHKFCIQQIIEAWRKSQDKLIHISGFTPRNISENSHDQGCFFHMLFDELSKVEQLQEFRVGTLRPFYVGDIDNRFHISQNAEEITKWRNNVKPFLLFGNPEHREENLASGLADISQKVEYQQCLTGWKSTITTYINQLSASDLKTQTVQKFLMALVEDPRIKPQHIQEYLWDILNLEFSEMFDNVQQIDWSKLNLFPDAIFRASEDELKSRGLEKNNLDWTHRLIVNRGHFLFYKQKQHNPYDLKLWLINSKKSKQDKNGLLKLDKNCQDPLLPTKVSKPFVDFLDNMSRNQSSQTDFEFDIGISSQDVLDDGNDHGSKKSTSPPKFLEKTLLEALKVWESIKYKDTLRDCHDEILELLSSNQSLSEDGHDIIPEAFPDSLIEMFKRKQILINWPFDSLDDSNIDTPDSGSKYTVKAFAHSAELNFWCHHVSRSKAPLTKYTSKEDDSHALDKKGIFQKWTDLIKLQDQTENTEWKSFWPTYTNTNNQSLQEAVEAIRDYIAKREAVLSHTITKVQHPKESNEESQSEESEAHHFLAYQFLTSSSEQTVSALLFLPKFRKKLEALNNSWMTMVHKCCNVHNLSPSHSDIINKTKDIDSLTVSSDEKDKTTNSVTTIESKYFSPFHPFSTVHILEATDVFLHCLKENKFVFHNVDTILSKRVDTLTSNKDTNQEAYWSRGVSQKSLSSIFLKKHTSDLKNIALPKLTTYIKQSIRLLTKHYPHTKQYLHVCIYDIPEYKTVVKALTEIVPKETHGLKLTIYTEDDIDYNLRVAYANIDIHFTTLLKDNEELGSVHLCVANYHSGTGGVFTSKSSILSYNSNGNLQTTLQVDNPFLKSYHRAKNSDSPYVSFALNMKEKIREDLYNKSLFLLLTHSATDLSFMKDQRFFKQHEPEYNLYGYSKDLTLHAHGTTVNKLKSIVFKMHKSKTEQSLKNVEHAMLEKIAGDIDELKFLSYTQKGRNNYVAAVSGERSSKEFIDALTFKSNKEYQGKLLFFLDLDLSSAQEWTQRKEEKNNRADLLAVLSIPSKMDRDRIVFLVIEAKGLYPYEGLYNTEQSNRPYGPMIKAPKQAYTIAKNLHGFIKELQNPFTTDDSEQSTILSRYRALAFKRSLYLGLRQALENVSQEIGTPHIKAFEKMFKPDAKDNQDITQKIDELEQAIKEAQTTLSTQTNDIVKKALDDSIRGQQQELEDLKKQLSSTPEIFIGSAAVLFSPQIGKNSKCDRDDDFLINDWFTPDRLIEMVKEDNQLEKEKSIFISDTSTYFDLPLTRVFLGEDFKSGQLPSTLDKIHLLPNEKTEDGSEWSLTKPLEDVQNITQDIQTALDAQAQSTELTNAEDTSSDEDSSSEDSVSEESSSDETSTEAVTTESIVSDGDTNSESDTSDTTPATTDED